MNIYEKLADMRIELQATEIKKSGRNTFAGYDYMELGDFLPKINEILASHKVASIVSFGSDEATLRLVNAEKPDEAIVFASPMSTASLKGCHDVQNLGAVQTYLRRYLYVSAFEIVEHDALDGITSKEDRPAQPKLPSSSQGPAQRPAAPNNGDMCSGCGGAITPQERSYSKSKYGAELCRKCQAGHGRQAG